MTPINRLLPTLLGLSALACTACATTGAGKNPPPTQHSAPAPTATGDVAAEPPADAPSADAPSASARLSADASAAEVAQAQFDVMAGELAAGREQPGEAARYFLDALRVIEDAGLAQRATQLAVNAADPALAMQAARRWLELAPNEALPRELLLQLAFEQGDLATTLEQAQARAEGDAESPGAGMRTVARLLMHPDQARGDAALSVMRSLVERWPDDAGAHAALGLVASHYRRYTLTAQAAQEAMRLQPDNPEYALLLVSAQIHQEKFDDAAALMDHIAVGPLAADLRYGYARLLTEAGQRVAARDQLDVVLKLRPNDANARYARGMFALAERDLAAARSYFTPLLEGPRAADAALQLGRLAEAQKDDAEALQFYARIDRGPAQLEARLRSAAVLADRGRLDEARALLAQQREELPQYGLQFLLAEGELLVQAQQFEEALSLYADGLDVVPGQPDILYARSLAYEARGTIADAEKDLRRMLEQNPRDARAANALGYLLAVHSTRYAEAHDLIETALEQDPDNAAILDSMGWVEFKRGNLQSAEDWLRKAYARMPDGEVAAHLGEVLWVQGRQQEARELWQTAVEREPGHQVLQQTVERLTQ